MMMMMMMMFYNRTRKLPFSALSNLPFTLPSQVSIFPPTSTILTSKGPNFTTIFTPFSSIKRFYCVHPPSPTHDDDDAPRRIKAKAALEWYFARSFETVPYTNRTRRVICSSHFEKRFGDAYFKDFNEMYQENEEIFLSPTHPDVVRVRMVFNKIIDALENDLEKMGNSASSYNSIAERILMSLSRKTPPATTYHLDGMDWNVFVVNDPNLPPNLPSVRCFNSEGKIVVNQYLVNRLVDLEIAAVLGHQVARIVARFEGEKMTKEMWITFLNDILGEDFTKHIGQRIISFIQQLPSNTRLTKEADYIGIQILTSAGYDPKQVVEVYERMRIINM